MNILKRTQGIDTRAKSGALRGDVCFQLRDVDTGKVKHEERGHNMLTNGLNNALNLCPFQLNNVSSGYGSTGNGAILKNTPIYSQLLGGVQLFNDALGNDTDLLFPSFGNKIHGFASLDENYSQTDPRQGTYDGVSSRVIANGFQHVFSWGSAYGNTGAGEHISSLGLSTRNTHTWCYGVDNCLKPFVVNSNNGIGFKRGMNGSYSRLVATDDTYGSIVSCGTGYYNNHDTIYYFPQLKPFTVDLFEGVNGDSDGTNMLLDFDNPFDTNHRRGYKWKITQLFGGLTARFYNIEFIGGYAYAIFHNGSVFTVKKIDLSDGTITTNTYTFVGSFNGTYPAVLYGDYIFCASSTAGKILKCNTQNLAVTEIDATGLEANASLFWCGTQFIYSEHGIFDVIAEIYVNMTGTITNWDRSAQLPVADYGNWLLFSQNPGMSAVMKQWGLMTHYDLNSPVTKDSSKQMIVEYSITQV